jgi:hypothetical protein
MEPPAPEYFIVGIISKLLTDLVERNDQVSGSVMDMEPWHCASPLTVLASSYHIRSCLSCLRTSPPFTRRGRLRFRSRHTWRTGAFDRAPLSVLCRGVRCPRAWSDSLRAESADVCRRILKYAGCSEETFILALIYMDQVVQFNPEFVISSLNVHRLLITSIMVSRAVSRGDARAAGWHDPPALPRLPPSRRGSHTRALRLSPALWRTRCFLTRLCGACDTAREQVL